MHLWQSSLVLIEGAIAASAASTQSCLSRAPTPFAVPIRNVTMQGSNAVRRGAAISVGSPPQTLAFEISPDTNDTMVFDATNNTCQLHPGSYHTKPNSTAVECFSFYGGLFDKRLSSSWTSAVSAAALGLVSPVTQLEGDANFTYGVDTLGLTADVNNLSGHPLVLSPGTSTTEGFFLNAIGVGSNSTLLNQLMSTGHLASNVWSIYDGWTGPTSQTQSNGTMVFGGYDAAKTTGENATFKINTDPTDTHDTGWAVTMKDIELHFTNGSRASLFAQDEAGSCNFYILPSYPYISIGDQLWTNFLSLSGSTQTSRSLSALSWWQEIIAADTAYTGDLVMTLDSGLQIKIPNHQLIKPLVDIDANGVSIIQNDSTARLTALYSGGTGYHCGLLGRAFLSSAYMMVDKDQKQLTLWQGRPSEEQKLVAVGAPAVCTTPAPVSSATSTASPATSSVDTITPAVSKGGVAGIAVAAASFVISCVGIGIYLFRRQAKQQQATLRSQETKTSHRSVNSDGKTFQKPELSSDHDHLPRQELPLGRNQSDTIPPYEMIANQSWAQELPGNGRSATEMAG